MAESVYDGTWASGPLPQEMQDFELMREMHWSWEALQATPHYVRRFTWDLILTRRAAEKAANEKASRQANHGR